PLDVGIFNVLKVFFYKETAKYTMLKAHLLIQKRWFISAYEVAYAKAMTLINIRHAFRGAGTFPINIEKPLSKVVVPECPPSPKLPPKTPQKRKGLIDQMHQTPKNYREARQRLALVEKSTGPVPRSLRILITETGR
ncbi:hypothetical protein DER44DRAFT_669394, partial [Fusarium oxysporum]